MVRCIDDLYALRRAAWTVLAARYESRRGRVRYPLTALVSCASCRPWDSRGRPRLWYRPGDLVCVGGVDGVYIRRIDGTKGRAHLLAVELPSVGLASRHSASLIVWGPVELLLRDVDQLRFEF